MSRGKMTFVDCYGISGSLDKLLFENNHTLSEREKIDFVKGIARGMLHLHNHNTIHRDLAARNILLTESGQPKISVFFSSSCIPFNISQFFVNLEFFE
jgi:serine/threonine protein kinase